MLISTYERETAARVALVVSQLLSTKQAIITLLAQNTNATDSDLILRTYMASVLDAIIMLEEATELDTLMDLLLDTV